MSQPFEQQPHPVYGADLNSVAHHTALEARLKADTDALIEVFDIGEEPDPLPDYFAIPHVERMYLGPEGQRGGGWQGVHGWRVTVRVYARTAGGCRWALFEVSRALEGRPLTVAGTPTTPLEFESERSPEPSDDGFCKASTRFTYSS